RRAVAVAELVNLGATNSIEARSARVRRIHLGDLHSQHRTPNTPVSQEVVEHLTSECYRNRETIARKRTRTRRDSVVDADHLATDVHQRAARVAGVYRRVRLDEVRDRVVAAAGKVELP